MAITIIKGGKNEFRGHCKWCGCDFRYHEEDVTNNPQPPQLQFCSVDCPCCKRQLEHAGENGTSKCAQIYDWMAEANSELIRKQTELMKEQAIRLGYRKDWEVK